MAAVVMAFPPVSWRREGHPAAIRVPNPAKTAAVAIVPACTVLFTWFAPITIVIAIPVPGPSRGADGKQHSGRQCRHPKEILEASHIHLQNRVAPKVFTREKHRQRVKVAAERERTSPVMRDKRSIRLSHEPLMDAIMTWSGEDSGVTSAVRLCGG